MKRSGFGPPTAEQIRRSEERRRASMERYQARVRQRALKELETDPPKRKKRRRLKPNAERLKKLRAEQFGEQADLCRHLPCACHHPELYGVNLLALDRRSDVRISDPHHSPTVGAGGKDRDTAPTCRPTHRKLDSPGNSEASVLRELNLPADWFRMVAARLDAAIRRGL